ncbi:helix-turn-helix transcriptional regulator [Streptomyces sp. NPDC046942]|uniref:helix-turn-helix domain-containing protein n=1 Tax=Streptomyces sp. NPDC046942 TaxID=3155137 RepID=UPI0033C66818
MRSSDDLRGDIRQFLTSRRARVTPEQAGLPDYGGPRRVKGLRRSEVAQLANISVEYYIRLERGNVQGVSDEVLHALASALHLDDVERTHLEALVKAANTSSTSATPAPNDVRPQVVQLLDAMTDAAAFIRNARLDVLAANQLGHALYQPVFDTPAEPPNLARFVFTDPRARWFYRNWQTIAHDAAGSLRAEAARAPSDTLLADLVAELTTASEEFRRRWRAHEVEYYRTGQQDFHHPDVGDISLDYEALELPASPGLTIVAYTAAPGSPAAGALAALRARA